MINGKIAGLTFGGIAGYLILSKSIRLVEHTVAYIADASKWKAYYKYGSGKEGQVNCIVPPGYSSSTRDIGNGKEIVIEDPKQKVSENGSEEDIPKKDLKAALAAVVSEVVKDWAKVPDEPKGASEGQETASEEDISEESEPEGEIVTERDENGNPIAGRYPFGEDNEDTNEEEQE